MRSQEKSHLATWKSLPTVLSVGHGFPWERQSQFALLLPLISKTVTTTLSPIWIRFVGFRLKTSMLPYLVVARPMFLSVTLVRSEAPFGELLSGSFLDTQRCLVHCQNRIKVVNTLAIVSGRQVDQGAVKEHHRLHFGRRVRHADSRGVIIDRTSVIVLLRLCHSPLVQRQGLSAVRKVVGQPVKGVHLSRAFALRVLERLIGMRVLVVFLLAFFHYRTAVLVRH